MSADGDLMVIVVYGESGREVVVTRLKSDEYSFGCAHV
ncbi:hypothetical protein HMPREF1162_1200 [ [[Propionibacterium] namnetense SK182B-JCVI]|uniref:Uncharacterized protein n=1 Tax=[Propionibacterium] namnetense SK182B-JCVI TaxID=1051006 RepID=F9NUJ8_9ACTN|nr:hypothetical protein HMPREF1162_1200 [ [[Propionibacterium] namnetense SK182B-JCVI]